jgi:hypothetical protein
MHWRSLPSSAHTPLHPARPRSATPRASGGYRRVDRLGREAANVVIARRFCGNLVGGIVVRGGALDVAQPGFELEALVQLTQQRRIGARQCELGDAHRQRAVGLHRQKPASFGQPGQRAPQVVADDAWNLRGARDDVVETAVLIQPFGRGLRANLRHAGDVVDTVAGEREQVEHLIGTHAEFPDHTFVVERLVAHRVHARDA